MNNKARRAIGYLSMLILAGVVTGCGGGGNDSSSPAASPSSTPIVQATSTPPTTPTPLPTPVPVNTTVSTTDTDAIAVHIDWLPTSSVPADRIIEYQVFRDGQAIGVTPRNDLDYIDRTDSRIVTVYLRVPMYNDTGEGGGTGYTLPTIAYDRPPLVAGVPHVYSIRALYQSEDNVAIIAAIGESNAVTLPTP